MTAYLVALLHVVRTQNKYDTYSYLYAIKYMHLSKSHSRDSTAQYEMVKAEQFYFYLRLFNKIEKIQNFRRQLLRYLKYTYQPVKSTSSSNK